MGHQHINEVSGVESERQFQNSAELKNKTDWIIFGVFLVIMIISLIFFNEWFWLFLPFVMTYFVKAVDAL